MKNEYEKLTVEVIEVELGNCIAGSNAIPEPEDQPSNFVIPKGNAENNVINGNTSWDKW